MSQNSAIAIFPFKNDFENNCLARATTINDTFISAIKAWIVTKRGSRLGNMVGCFLPDLIYELVGVKDLSGYANKLKSNATDQFPGINFIDVYMEFDYSNSTVDLIVKITFSTQYTDIQQLDIILPTQVQTSTIN